MDHSIPRLSDRTVVVCAIVIAAIVGFCGINPYLPGGGDNAAYIAEGEAWLSMGRRANLFEAGSPTDTLKPPLFSLILAGVEALFGRNVAAMKALALLFALASVWVSYRALSGARRSDEIAEFSPSDSALVTLWFAMAPSLMLYSHDVLADVPFTFLTLINIGLIARATKTDSKAATFIFLCLILIMSTQLRSAGVIAIAASSGVFAVEAFFAIEKHQRKRLLMQAAVLLLLAVIALAYHRSSERNYLKYAADLEPAASGMQMSVHSSESLGARLLRVGAYYAIYLPAEISVFGGFGPEWAVYGLAIMSAVIVSLGVVHLFRQGQRIIPIFWLLYQAAMLLWPFLDARFYLPVLALYIFCFYAGVKFAIDVAHNLSKAAAGMTAFVMMLAPLVSLFGSIFFFGEFDPGESTLIEWGAAVVTAAVLLGWLISKGSSNDRRKALFFAVLAVFLSLAVLRSFSENLFRERSWGPAPAMKGGEDLYEAAQFLRAQQPGAIVMSAKPSLIWFWSGHQGVSIPRTTDRERLAAELQKVNWVIIDGLSEDQLAWQSLHPYLRSNPDKWVPEWNRNNTTIWRRMPGDVKNSPLAP